MSKTPENRNTPEQETVDEGAAMAEQALPSNAPVGTPEWAKPLYMELRDIKSHLKQSDQRTADAIKDVYGQLRSAKNDTCELQERSKDQEDKIVDLSRNISKLSLENKSLKDKLVRLEAYNRRSNLLITGIEESRTASDDDCRRIAYKCMSDIGVSESDKILIARCHRYGLPKAGLTRAIIVRFEHFEDRQKVWAKRMNSKKAGKDVYINEDFPPEMIARRNKIYPCYKAAIDCGKYKGKVMRREDFMILEGKRYTVENLHELPEGINPKSLCEKWSNNSVGFFHGESPLSNHFLAEFKYEGITFNSSEQALMHQKAIQFGDKKAAEEILNSDDPRDQKKLGHNIRNYKEKDWKAKRDEVMKSILLAKFTQVDGARFHLLSTESRTSCESNPKDDYWGTGIPLHDANALDKDKWKGANKLGQYLEELRSKLI